MRKARTDSVIAEIWAIGDEHAARFDYDVAAIFRDLRARQENSGRVYVSLPARRIEPGSEFGASSRRKQGTNNPPDMS